MYIWVVYRTGTMKQKGLSDFISTEETLKPDGGVQENSMNTTSDNDGMTLTEVTPSVSSEMREQYEDIEMSMTKEEKEYQTGPRPAFQ